MLEVEKLDSELYNAKYGVSKIGDANAIWNQIKNQPEILKEAVKIKKNKWNEDLVTGLTICEAMLMDYSNVNQEAYNELIKLIYTNANIARIIVNAGDIHNERLSYLLMSLWNPSLKLTKEQKSFAVHEVINELHIHGSGFYDIRYQILRNPNWSLKEKQKLMSCFWEDEETFDEYLEQWEYGVVNDSANYKGHILPFFDRYALFNDCSYNKLLQFYKDKETTDRIWDEIEFCKQMRTLKAQQWEVKRLAQVKKFF